MAQLRMQVMHPNPLLTKARSAKSDLSGRVRSPLTA
jgi:hypothetical protein